MLDDLKRVQPNHDEKAKEIKVFLKLRLGVHKGMEWNDHKGMKMNVMELNVFK